MLAALLETVGALGILASIAAKIAVLYARYKRRSQMGARSHR
jgi:hypothetical protein